MQRHIIVKAIDSGGGVIFSVIRYKKYQQHPVETENGLANRNTLENFLLKIFTMAGFREVISLDGSNGLLNFHQRNKLLLMAFSKENVFEMEMLIKDDRCSILKIERYEKELLKVLSHSPGPTSFINEVIHTFDDIPGQLSKEDGILFFNSIENYRDGVISLNKFLNNISLGF